MRCNLLFYSGFGFVEIRNVEDAERAIEALNGSIVDGSDIKVDKARRKNGYAKTPGRCTLCFMLPISFLLLVPFVLIFATVT